MAKKIIVKKEEWKPEGGLESSGKVEKAKIKVKPLSSATKGKIDSDLKTKKKKTYRPRPPRKKGDATEKTFQYLRGRQDEKRFESQMDDFLKSNPEYKKDTKLKRIRTRKK